MRRWARIGGWLLAALAIGYFADAAYRNFAAIPVFRTDPLGLAMAAAAIVAYGLSVPLAALAWRWLLGAAGQDLPYAPSLAIFSLTQIAKYVPGGVANFIGRIELARLWGVNVGVSSVSVTFEFLLVLGTGVALAAAAPVVLPGYGLSAVPAVSIWGLLAAAVALLVPLSLLLAMTAASRQLSVFLRIFSRPQNFLRLVGVVLAYVACYIVVGASLVALAFGPAAAPRAGLVELTVVWAAVFVGGYLAPGVPAGLGVREALIVAMLTPVYGEGPALALALYFRVVAVVADAGIALSSLLLSRRLRQAFMHIGGVHQDAGQRVANCLGAEAGGDLAVQDPAGQGR
jgi:glycosyltransferase 2 family protein